MCQSPAAKGEQTQADPRTEAREGSGTMALEAELTLAGLKDRLDPLAHRPARSEAPGLVLSIGTQEASAQRGDELLELLAREALVGDDGVTPERSAGEPLAGEACAGRD